MGPRNDGSGLFEYLVCFMMLMGLASNYDSLLALERSRTGTGLGRSYLDFSFALKAPRHRLTKRKTFSSLVEKELTLSLQLFIL